MKTEVVPVVIGALGLIKKGQGRFFNKVLGSINLQEVQKTLIIIMTSICVLQLSIIIYS